MMRTNAMRSTSLETTWGKICPASKDIGVTRIAEVTHLDRIGIPVWQAIRPRSRNLSVSQGKGLCDLSAKVSAVMEAFELHAAEAPPVDRSSSLGALLPVLTYDIASLAHGPHRLEPGQDIEWSSAESLTGRGRSWVPTELLRLDFTRDRLCLPLFPASSTGLAAGLSREDAILHGLYEVVERDATLRSPPWDKEVFAPAALACDPVIGSLVEKIEKAHIRLSVARLPTRIGIPCAEARLEDGEQETNFLGSAANLCPRRAIVGAVLEAVQSRLTNITGSRDDIAAEEYFGCPISWRTPATASPLPETEERNPAWLPIQPLGSAAEQIKDLTARFEAAGLDPLVVDLTGQRCVPHVVFVVVPGLRRPS